MALVKRSEPPKGQKKGQVQESLTPRTAITSLAEHIQSTMSALYDYHSLQLKDAKAKSNKRIQDRIRDVTSLRKELHDLCERIVSCMRRCHGVIEDFVFIARSDFDKQPPRDQTEFVKSIIPRTQTIAEEFGELQRTAEALGERQLVKTFVGKKSKPNKPKNNVLKDTRVAEKGRVGITDPRVALETAGTALNGIIASLESLENFWIQDNNALKTLLEPGPKKTLQLPSGAGARDMKEYWTEYQKNLLTAESSIMESSDALRVDPPTSTTAANPKKASLFARLAQIFGKKR